MKKKIKILTVMLIKISHLTCNQKYNGIGRHEWPPFLSEERRDKQPRDAPDLDRHGVSSGQSQAEESPDDFPEAWGET